MTSTQQAVLEAVKTYKPARGMNPVPGMPVSHFPHEWGEALRGFLTDGTLRLIEVTKPNKVDPTKTTTYAYVALGA